MLVTAALLCCVMSWNTLKHKEGSLGKLSKFTVKNKIPLHPCLKI